MTVEESINIQVLHWATPQGKVPLSGDDFGVGYYELVFLECFCCVCRAVSANDANQPVARHFNSGSHCISDMRI